MGSKKSKSSAPAASGDIANMDPVDAALAMIADESVEPGPVSEEIAAETEVEIEATDAVDASPEDVDAALAEIEAQAAAAAPAPTKGKSKRKTSTTPKTPAAPVILRQFTDVASIDAKTLKTNLDGITAKKVNEKAGNLIAAIERGSKLSRYTADAVRHLTAEKRVSGKSLVEMFQARGLSLGTARAQAQQMTALFKGVGLVTQDPAAPRELVLADNDLATELVSLAA